jgi:hypothetical protein
LYVNLKGELGATKSDFSTLVTAMEKSMNQANDFIKKMEK